MTKSIPLKIILIFLVCFVFLFFGKPLFPFSKKKVILTTHNLYPYGSYPEDSEIKFIADDSFHGEAVDIVRCIFKKMEIPLEIQVVPWKRAQMLAISGEADGFFAASQLDSRDAFAVMSDVIASQKWNWYLLKDNPLNPNDPSFKTNAEVAGFIGANMLGWMEENGYQVKARPIDTEGLLNILLDKRVDAVMANNYVMDALLVKQGVKDKVKVYLNQDKPLGAYFSKKFLNSRPEFMKEFNRLIPECREKNVLATDR